MNKLYCLKLKPPVVKRAVVDKGYHPGLSKQEVIDLIFKNGIGEVEIIRHDDKNPVNQHRLEHWEFLEIWKGVAAKQKSN